MFQFKFKNKELEVLVANIKIITIHNNNLKKLVTTIPALNFYLSSLISESVPVEKEELLSEISLFEKAYFEASDEYYGRKSKIRNFKNPTQLGHIKEAIEICRAHNVTYKTFLKAQIEGLKVIAAITQKNDYFPVPGHLSTKDAEKRLLDHIGNKKKLRPVLKLSKEEQELTLKRNLKFIKYWDLFMGIGDITLDEALYLEACLKARGKEIPKKLDDWIESKLVSKA
jgi:hypothetical protein